MAASSHSRRDEPSDDATTPVGVYESRPGRLVFIEEGNSDAWISTDHAVEPRS